MDLARRIWLRDRRYSLRTLASPRRSPWFSATSIRIIVPTNFFRSSQLQQARSNARRSLGRWLGGSLMPTGRPTTPQSGSQIMWGRQHLYIAIYEEHGFESAPEQRPGSSRSSCPRRRPGIGSPSRALALLRLVPLPTTSRLDGMGGSRRPGVVEINWPRCGQPSTRRSSEPMRVRQRGTPYPPGAQTPRAHLLLFPGTPWRGEDPGLPLLWKRETRARSHADQADGPPRSSESISRRRC